MSQATAAIANMSRTLFRAAVNAIAQAIQSMNSGATEPTETYSYMLWADTTSGWLKQRNTADSGWIFRWPLGTGAEVDVAAAATVDLGAQTSALVRITGTGGPITSFGTADAGRVVKVRHSAAATLTHNGTSLILPGAANITTAADHTYEAVSLGSGNWSVRAYQKADGTAVVAPSAVTKYTSSDQTITSGGLLTLAHSLGAAPFGINLELVCQIGELGYSAGDVVSFGASSFIQDGTTGANGGVAVYVDTTNVYVRVGSSVTPFAIQNKSTGAGGAGCTNANWKLRVKAWL